MKKFLSVILCTIIFAINVVFVPYTTPVYATGFVGGVIKDIAYNDVVKFFQSLFSVGYNCFTGDHDGDSPNSPSSTTLDSIWGENSAINKWMQTKLFPFMDANGNVDLTKPDCPITYDNEKQLVNFNPTFTKELGEQVQDHVHYLNGYTLYTPAHTLAEFPWDKFPKYSDSVKQKIMKDSFERDRVLFSKVVTSICSISPDDEIYYATGVNHSIKPLFVRSSSSTKWETYILKDNGELAEPDVSGWNPYYVSFIEPDGNIYHRANSAECGPQNVVPYSMEYAYGNNPIRCFYTFQDLKNFVSKGRTYVPQLPSTTISIPIKYINNTTELPDLSFNLDSLIGKAEADIQAGLDAQLKLYLDKLADVNIKPDKPINPTPTPDGGFTDGTTPTPKPDFGDGSDLTDTNDWLKKIYEWLQSFGDTHSKFEKTITDYIEANDGKLDQIIEAINALSGGKTEDEKNGCKYDFTALSDFMTKLWNESDKKFDKMVELLEENNKYQKKLVNSLNEIKAILVTQTIMDVFQDRSQQTAEKAKDKFPTSLPWDIALVVNAMSAEPEKPQFNLPIQIKSLNINEEIHVDLASGEWEKLAKTCRYLLSILFILLIIQLSRKLFSNGGDD